ncbi:MAG: hypothetical protein JNL80_07525 [Phycisphaerae bacterium]|jgi:predicted tellurium resistance membrane protein TerC|nr:hypothetical protein [Phycisphaerae bacterium]
MIQTLINALLGLGYIAGLILVWIGLEMFVIDGRRFAPSFLSIVAGVGLWALLVATGKALHRQAIRRMEAQR